MNSRKTNRGGIQLNHTIRNNSIKRRNERSKTREMVIMGLSIALVYVATLIQFELPTPNGGGLVHLGTGMSYILALVYGKKVGAVSGSVAMGMFDIFSKYTIWAPTTIITRAIMGYVVGKIATKNGESGNSFTRNAIAIVVGGAIMIAGYYVGEAVTFGNWITPAASVGGNLLQIIVGGAGALAIVPALKKSKVL